jgi:RNA polymerase sigma-70 factor (ECF subfamily)
VTPIAKTRDRDSSDPEGRIRRIIRDVLAGHRDAYRAIVKEYGSTIGAFLAAHLSQPDTVEDLAQETFIAAFESLGTFRQDEDFGYWLKGIARNKLLMHLRRHYQHGEAVEKLKARAVEKVMEETCRRQEGDDARSLDRLRQCLEKLPPRTMDVVRARYFNRERVTSIAGKLGTTAAAISALLFRGRKELETCLGRSR